MNRIAWEEKETMREKKESKDQRGWSNWQMETIIFPKTKLGIKESKSGKSSKKLEIEIQIHFKYFNNYIFDHYYLIIK